MKWDNLPGKQRAPLHCSRDLCSMSEFAFEIDPNHLAQVENVHNSGFHSSKCSRDFLVTSQSALSFWPMQMDYFLSPAGCAASIGMWLLKGDMMRLHTLAPVCKSNAMYHTGDYLCCFLSSNCSEAHHKQSSLSVLMFFLPFLPIMRVIFMQRGMSTLQKPVLPFWFPPFCLFGAFFE